MQVTAGGWTGQLGRQMRDDALALRAQVFRGGASDEDAFDAAASHLVIRDATGVVACARLKVQDPAGILAGYTAQAYDLTRFAQSFPKAVELGRVCLAPECHAPEVTRLMLGMTAQLVTQTGALALFGCASFAVEGAALAGLRGSEAPDTWRPGRKAPETTPLGGASDRARLPPLLRAYLAMGAKVSDHAVVDRDLGTIHVFTGLPVAAISPARARLLTSMLAPA